MNDYSKKILKVPTVTFVREQDRGKQPVLDVRNLGIDFGGLTAVDSFNITIGPTEISGLIGPNGAGKTTIFNLLTGVYQQRQGRSAQFHEVFLLLKRFASARLLQGREARQ